MENKDKDKKQNDQIISQGTNEIESLNDSEELDLEKLEEVAGGGRGCIVRGKGEDGFCFIRWRRRR